MPRHKQTQLNGEIESVLIDFAVAFDESCEECSVSVNAFAKQIERLLVGKLRKFNKYETSHDVLDHVEIEFIRIQNLGYEEAHKLRPCGHSQGDFRDPDYGTEKYVGNESCVGCDSVEGATRRRNE